MKVLRAGGEYLSNREKQLWMGLAAVFIILVAVALVTRKALAFLLVGAYALSAIKPLLRRLDRVRKGRLGERLVADLLTRLSDDYYLINDLTLPGVRGNIDHVLVGPCGVVAIETKRIAGEITCKGDYWYVKGRRRKSISRQVNEGALAIKTFLARHHPELSRSTIGFIEAVVVFTHPLCRLTVNGARATVVRYSELLQLVTDLAKKHHMSVELAERLARSIART